MSYARVHTARQAIPGSNEKTPWIKGDYRTPARGQEGEKRKDQEESERRKVNQGMRMEGHGEHRVIGQQREHAEYPCCRKLADRHKA